MNVIERAVVLTRNEYLDADDLPGISRESAAAREVISAHGSGITLREMERILIERTLADTDSNRTHAARILGHHQKDPPLEDQGIRHRGVVPSRAFRTG